MPRGISHITPRNYEGDKKKIILWKLFRIQLSRAPAARHFRLPKNPRADAARSFWASENISAGAAWSFRASENITAGAARSFRASENITAGAARSFPASENSPAPGLGRRRTGNRFGRTSTASSALYGTQ